MVRSFFDLFHCNYFTYYGNTFFDTHKLFVIRQVDTFLFDWIGPVHFIHTAYSYGFESKLEWHRSSIMWHTLHVISGSEI